MEPEVLEALGMSLLPELGLWGGQQPDVTAALKSQWSDHAQPFPVGWFFSSFIQQIQGWWWQLICSFFVSLCPQASRSQSPVVAVELQGKTRSLTGLSTCLAVGEESSCRAAALKYENARSGHSWDFPLFGKEEVLSPLLSWIPWAADKPASLHLAFL